MGLLSSPLGLNAPRLASVAVPDTLRQGSDDGSGVTNGGEVEKAVTGAYLSSNGNAFGSGAERARTPDAPVFGTDVSLRFGVTDGHGADAFRSFLYAIEPRQSGSDDALDLGRNMGLDPGAVTRVGNGLQIFAEEAPHSLGSVIPTADHSPIG